MVEELPKLSVIVVAGMKFLPTTKRVGLLDILKEASHASPLYETPIEGDIGGLEHRNPQCPPPLPIGSIRFLTYLCYSPLLL